MIGKTISHYKILEKLGQEGMGEVYRAEDTNLGRQVAIKVLPEHLANDPGRRERFEREARAVSSLNHPHICILHDIGEQDGIYFLVMEYIEGETLAERLKKGPLPLDEALRYAVEIADALDKAHRQGVVHRDVKPGNMMLTKLGAKLLDFGLAKFREAEASGGVSSALPTQQKPLTDDGAILGTFQYMAPEQLEGKDADARTDIFAFGALLYEMVTGRKAFEGKSQASLIGAILERDPPPISSLQPMTPPALDHVVKTCLAKDPDSRWQTSGDVGRQLTRIAGAGAQAGVVAAAQPRGWQRTMPCVAAALATGLVVGLAVWTLTRPAPAPPQPVMRFPVVLPSDQQLTRGGRHQVALSPDGTHLAYVANRQLYLRAMNQVEATPLRGIQDPIGAFFSPDGQWISFYQGGQLKKVAVTGGAPVALCDTLRPLGASWGPEDTILFGQGRAGILQVAGAGGTPETLIAVDEGEAVRQPQILPGGEAVLFTLRPEGASSFDQAQVVVQSLETGERRVLVDGGTDARYLPTGHLVYAQAGTLFAVPFDLARLEVTGGPVSLVEDVAENSGTGVAQFSVSGTGSLVYVPRASGDPPRTLVWVDRQGREEPLAADPRAYRYPRLSPDGTQVALDVRDQESDILIWDLARETLTHLTFDPAGDFYPVWTPDGRRVVFSSTREGVSNLFWKAADGTGVVERLTESPHTQYSQAVSPDGTHLVFKQFHPGTGNDLGLLAVEGERVAEPLLVATEFNERNAELSPDGRWLAYESNASGQFEIYVRPFPNVDEGRWQISTGGGVQPLWGPDGRELYYLTTDEEGAYVDPAGRLMAVPVQPDPTFTAGDAEVVVDGRYFRFAAGRTYDISSDGERFLMIKEAEQTDEASARTELIVVQNWFEELKRLVPTN